jgi:hypothetical protein
MYNCRICHTTSKPGQALVRHIVYRNDGQIEREIPVCPTCHALLGEGVPLSALARHQGKFVPIGAASRGGSRRPKGA